MYAIMTLETLLALDLIDDTGKIIYFQKMIYFVYLNQWFKDEIV